MPNDQWQERTTLVGRIAPQSDAEGKISFARIEGELALVPVYLLSGFKADIAQLGVLAGDRVDLGPIIGRSDEILVDLKDHKLVDKGLFLAQVGDRLLACRAIEARSVWLLSPTEQISSETLIEDHRVLGRIRLVWKRV